MNDLPRELIERILCTCDFNAWCRARFVCHTWAKICTEYDWKTDEFTQYKFRDKNSTEIFLAQNSSNHYEPCLPNGIKHGMSYHYYNDSENIYKMNLWIYGKSILELSYTYLDQQITNLSCVMNDIVLRIVYCDRYYLIIISGNGKYQKLEFYDM